MLSPPNIVSRLKRQPLRGLEQKYSYRSVTASARQAFFPRKTPPEINSAHYTNWTFALMAILLLATASGTVPAQQSSQSQTSAQPAPAPIASAQLGTKKQSETATPATMPPVTTPIVADPHQAQIIADTQKLLKLSQELKAEVAKSNKDTLSLTVVKKAEEVEKLAKTLKDELSKSHF